MHKRYSAIALCCIAAALAGCGSSGDSASNPNGLGAPNNNVFRTGLAGLCTQIHVAYASSPAKAVVIIDRLLPQLKALTARGSLGPEYQQYLANVEAAAADLRTGNVKAAKAEQQKNAVLGKELGVPACA